MTENKMPSRGQAIALESYETFGEDYAKAIETNAYNAHFERPSTLALIPDLKGKHVLDAGCGPGAYTRWFLEQKAEVVGVDVSPAMLEIAKRKFAGQATFHLHDLSQPMSFLKTSSFDFILSSLAIHYILDLKSLFLEFHRVLREGGQIVLSTHHPQADFSFSKTRNYYATELVEQEWTTIGRPVTVRFYRRPLSEITSAIQEAGFIIENISEGILTEDLKKLFPDVHKRLLTTPQFLFFRCAKCTKTHSHL